MGLLGEWTEEDTEQLDQIVHTVYHIMTAQIPTWSGRELLIAKSTGV